MMDGGVVQGLGDLGKVQIAFPDHLLAFLQPDATDILTGRDLQVLLKQGGQIAGADIRMLRYQRYGQLFTDILGNILLGLADNGIFVI